MLSRLCQDVVAIMDKNTLHNRICTNLVVVFDVRRNTPICYFINLIILHDVIYKVLNCSNCRYDIGIPLRSVICDLLYRTEIVAVDVATAFRLIG
uniref:Uncharacterized protein n=1 Tax=Hyaloperonospora arabidopsidis (strain Emoy2) TaxID=559515 RepID=M4BLC9_HYAAE